MITQIYGIISLQQALACIEAGADYIGLVLNNSIKKDHVSTELAKEIFSVIGDRAVKLAILDLDLKTEDEVIALAKELNPDILHLCGNVSTSEAFYNRFHRELPGMKLMQAVAMIGPEAIEFAVKNAPYADYYILDTVKKGASGVGAAGDTHDWQISRKIVEAVGDKVKVILAGGLGPDNVAAGIEMVHPFGVDSLTRTAIEKDGIYIGKDIGKVREFCRIAHTY